MPHFFDQMKKSILPFFIPNSGNETEPLLCLEDVEQNSSWNCASGMDCALGSILHFSRLCCENLWMTARANSDRFSSTILDSHGNPLSFQSTHRLWSSNANVCNIPSISALISVCNQPAWNALCRALFHLLSSSGFKAR